MPIKPSRKKLTAADRRKIAAYQNSVAKILKNPAAKRYYCVFQAQNNLWYQVAFFYFKKDAFEYAKAAHAAKGGQWRVTYTYPSSHNEPVK